MVCCGGLLAGGLGSIAWYQWAMRSDLASSRIGQRGRLGGRLRIRVPEEINNAFIW